MLQNDLSAMTLEKGTILIVDDNELNCERFCLLFFCSPDYHCLKR